MSKLPLHIYICVPHTQVVQSKKKGQPLGNTGPGNCQPKVVRNSLSDRIYHFFHHVTKIFVILEYNYISIMPHKDTLREILTKLRLINQLFITSLPVIILCMSQEILSKVILNKMTLAVGGGGSKLVVGGISGPT